MKKEIVVRTGRDRLRHSLLFELLLIAILAPLGALVFERPILDIGILTILLSLKAMLVNFVYNWLFDMWDVRGGRIPTERPLVGRLAHALGFDVPWF